MNASQLYEQVMDYIYVIGMAAIAIAALASFLWGKR